MEGKKMAKSAGNVMDPYVYIDIFGVDPFRYYVLREVSFGEDGSASDEGFIERLNADLANDLGNLLSRVTKMLHDYFGNRVPGEFPPELAGMEPKVRESLKAFHRAMESLEMHRALQVAWGLIGEVNKHLVATEPWKLHKEGGKEKELAASLYDAAESLRVIAQMIGPFMPGTARRIYSMLGLHEDPLEERIDQLEWGSLPHGAPLGEREPLFPRLDKDETLEAIARRRESTMAQDKPKTKADREPTAEELRKEPFPEGGELITFDEFKKVDLRVGVVREAQRVEGTDKLILMRVELGTQTRQLVAGIGHKYGPEEMVGKQIVVVANLKPAVIRGVRSEGMLLAAVDGNDLSLVTLDRDIAAGSSVE
jgi:methionyl-tRNA synthetase